MYPEIPEQLAALSAQELRALAAEIRKSVLAALADAGLTAEGLAEAETYKGHRSVILAEARDKELAAALAAEMGDESEDVEPGPPAEVIKTPDPVGPTADDPDPETPGPEPDSGGDDDDETKASSRRVRTSTGMAAVASPDADRRVRYDDLLAVEGIPGRTAGERFENWTDFASAILDKASMLDPGSPQKFPIGRALGNFDEDHRLTENLVHNLRLFEQEELTAAMCAPAVPTYNLGCANTDRRPVRNSLSSFQPAQRGAVTIYPSPSLSDITAGTGVGIWTSTNDATGGATKNPCATIACATPVEYRLYGIYRCITIKNMLQMTFPELVEAYLNRLAAAWARLAEVTLLNAMGTAVTTVSQAHVGWGGTTTIVHSILRYLSAYQELQRWDAPGCEVWMHRQLMYAIKADLMARKRTDGGRNMVPSDSEVNRIFTDAGVTPHWTLDVANWMSPVKQFSTASVLADFPRNVEMLIAPAGKFAVLDRGELNIGVTGNGLYRDNVSNSRNEFTFFFENYEGLVNTDSCPAHIIQINNVCWNGKQIHDAYVDCEGDATGGAGSGAT